MVDLEFRKLPTCMMEISTTAKRIMYLMSILTIKTHVSCDIAPIDSAFSTAAGISSRNCNVSLGEGPGLD
jgi:hypothetical protein